MTRASSIAWRRLALAIIMACVLLLPQAGLAAARIPATEVLGNMNLETMTGPGVDDWGRVVRFVILLQRDQGTYGLDQACGACVAALEGYFRNRDLDEILPTPADKMRFLFASQIYIFSLVEMWAGTIDPGDIDTRAALSVKVYCQERMKGYRDIGEGMEKFVRRALMAMARVIDEGRRKKHE